MNCQTARHRVLASERIELLAGDLQQHLDGCRPCRAWHARLLRIEKALPSVHVPPSRTLDHLVRQILQAQSPSPPTLPLPTARTNREGGRQKLALAFALAASLTVLAAGLWMWGPEHPNTPDHLRAYARERDRRIGPVRQEPHKCVEVLADYADELFADARATTDPARLDGLAQAYDRLVGDDLMRYAREVPPADRARVLTPVAERLSRRESEASRLAGTLLRTRRDDPRARRLHAIAQAAQKGNRDLLALIPA